MAEKPEETKVILHVTANQFAKGVFIDFADVDLVLSDNFFDLTSSEGRQICVKTDLSPEKLMEQIQIKSVYDIGAIES